MLACRTKPAEIAPVANVDGTDARREFIVADVRRVAIAQLAPVAVAPALHRRVIHDRAGVPPPRRDVDREPRARERVSQGPRHDPAHDPNHASQR
ncbi:hypothetical protein DB30_06619 [Enhygromyxa salina]|uniref:Uncharacterized protein n=1 Tax=Enhygromyxa salina TaxID=215803 RepID=A0A0C1ZAC3_9BACT|nr:hypothetical protein DB30_06619 [Enhygromyxa salina]